MNAKRFLLERSARLLVSAVASSLFVFAASSALADNASSHQMTPSKEMREKMAAMHEKMAACLRSDKPFAECRQEMMKSCQTMMGGKGCSMMGMGGMGHMGNMGNSPPPK